MAEVGRCETCRHWREPEFEPSWPGSPMSRGLGTCQLIEEWGYVGRELIPAAAVAGTWLYTRADFGCVLWELHDEPKGADNS